MFPLIFWPFLSATYVYAIIPQIQFHVCSPAIFLVSLWLQSRKKRLIEGNAECRCFFHLKNLTSKWTLRQVFICLKPRTPRTTYPPPLHTVYVYAVYLFTQRRGEGGRDEPERRLRGNSSQSWVEDTNMTDCISSL